MSQVHKYEINNNSFFIESIQTWIGNEQFKSHYKEENDEDDDPYDVVKNSLLLIDLLKSLMILTKDRTSKEENKLTQYAD